MANGHGGFRPGSGRPKGTHAGAQLKSRLSPVQQQRALDLVRLVNGDADTFDGDAYALLAFIYRSTDLPLSLRMRAAETAIAYERPKLASVVVKEVGGPSDVLRDLMQLVQGTGRGLPCKEVNARLASRQPYPAREPPGSVQTVRDTVRERV